MMTYRSINSYFIASYVLFLTLSCSSFSIASTVLQVDIDYMLVNAELVFEGEVLSHQSEWNAEHTGIYTAIVFRVDDVVKGDFQDTRLTLKFAGGIVGNEGVRVSGMVYPNVGEKGFYFVESLEKNLIHPLVGWSQGHFLIKRDESGESRVLTESDVPVLDFVSKSLTVTSSYTTEADTLKLFSKGVANGINVGEKNASIKKAMKKDNFKQVLKNKLQSINNTKRP